ncbi:MAG: hypothetical protein GY710_18315 [Desulfobacteraceae bacterium]|nr:hypothetical protein [Desulfobacteraceae bacterium]
MVFFTSILIMYILYYLQAEGFIYVTIIALAGELINIFMTHTLTRSVETRLNTQHKRQVDGFMKQLKAKKKTIQELEKIQDDSVTAIYKANMKITQLEKELAQIKETDSANEFSSRSKEQTKKPEEFIDLPDGSNRNSS